MTEVSCDNDQPVSPPSASSPVGPADDDNYKGRIKHAVANSAANKHCFKNYINYVDAQGKNQTLDPHIYVGDN